MKDLIVSADVFEKICLSCGAGIYNPYTKCELSVGVCSCLREKTIIGSTHVSREITKECKILQDMK